MCMWQCRGARGEKSRNEERRRKKFAKARPFLFVKRAPRHHVAHHRPCPWRPACWQHRRLAWRMYPSRWRESLRHSSACSVCALRRV